MANLSTPKFWQHRGIIAYGLLPLSGIFYLISRMRRWLQQRRCYSAEIKTPVLVVGNLSVGGNGKTPVLMALALTLSSRGVKIGIISRGYQCQTKQFPYLCSAESDPKLAGDEPVLIAKNTQLPVMVDPVRPRAVKALQELDEFDLILSDDGLQHYKLKRDFEIVVIGSQAALGNGYLLPAGPLREPLSRLKSVDWLIGAKEIAEVQYPIAINVDGIYDVNTEQQIALDFFSDKKVSAISGIAHPQRFFDCLTKLKIQFTPCLFPDHYQFSQKDIKGLDTDLILMTEKDAVKCRELKLKNAYYLKISVNLGQHLIDEICQRLQGVHSG